MTDRDLKPENCPLCRRPKWIDTSRWNRLDECAADAINPILGDRGSWIASCRAHALRVAALVAPVVEAAAWLNEAQPGYDRAARNSLHDALDAMRDGLAKLGTP